MGSHEGAESPVGLDDWHLASRELIEALRGKRTGAQLSRRLGYRTNVVADWEAGRRFPTAQELLRVCARVGIDVAAAFEGFHPATAEHLKLPADLRTPDAVPDLSPWLRALRGRSPIGLIAERAGCSRYAVGRWLKGQTRPRLPDFLRLVDAMTDRVSDLAAGLVPIEQLPTLQRRHGRRAAARELAFEYPDSEAMLRVMETDAYRALPRHEPGVLARALGIDEAREAEVLAALEHARIVELHGGRYRAREPLTVDTSGPALDRLRAHWTRAALQRLPARREGDWLGYNLMSMSQEDLERVREILRDTYRQIRALAAASEPVEEAALLNLQLVTFAVDGGDGAEPC